MEIGMPVFASVVGVLLTSLMTVGIMMLKGIRTELGKVNGRITSHDKVLTVHEANFARTDEQVKNLVASIKAAHSRMDRVEQKV